MDPMRPPAIGHRTAIKQLRSVIFVGIDGAAVVYPKGFIRKRLTPMVGGLGPLITAHTTDPLPDTPLYIAVTPDDFRIFGRPGLSSPFEIGRWKKGTYRASIREGGLRLGLDLELEGLGRVRLNSRPRFLAGQTRAVFELVVQGASGPAIQI
ncbi:MAG TPA: hypothetical protein VF990_00425 [Candidatus Dormibacteraeota bacterium]